MGSVKITKRKLKIYDYAEGVWRLFDSTTKRPSLPGGRTDFNIFHSNSRWTENLRMSLKYYLLDMEE